MKKGFSIAFLVLLLPAVMLLCICAGSVSLPARETLSILWRALCGLPQDASTTRAIVLSVRLPRVLCVMYVGAALSLCGAAMQGLLRNPLADGSTLGVSSGASLGAALSLAFGFSVPKLPFAGVTISAIVFAFLSLLLILTLAFALDRSLATNSILLIGVIFSMFATSLVSLVITFAGEKVKTITFWTMGSLAGSTYAQARLMGFTLLLGSTVLLSLCRELNAFSLGEEHAQHIGVNVRRVKLMVLITVSVLIGVCVSVGGSIGFVGLVTPHMARMLTGSDERRLLPASLYFGAVFLLLTDLAARIILRPLELPIGVVTSLIGSVLFVVLFARNRRRQIHA